MILLDDWHWADDLSRKLLGYLVRNLENRPVLFAVASRDDAGILPGSALVSLAPLTASDAAEMVKGMLGTNDVDLAFLDAFANLTGGNPLYVETSLRHLRENGVLANEKGRWLARVPLTAKHLPGSIQELLVERLQRLSASALKVARAAAALNRASSLPLLRRAAGLSDDELFEALEELRSCEVVALEEGAVAFLQGQLAEVVRSQTPEEDAIDLHTRIALALEEEGRDGLEAANERARHFLKSRDRRKAVTAALQAAKANLLLYALPEAREFFEHGFSLLEAGDTQPRLEYLYGLATLARYRNDLDLAMERYQDALAVAEERDDQAMQARILTSLGILHQIRKTTDTALELLHRSEILCQRTGDEREHLRCLQTTARVHYMRAEPLKALETSERAIALARASASRLDDSSSLAFMGLMLVSTDVPTMDVPTRIHKGIDFLSQAIDKKRALGDKVGINDSLNLLGNAQWICGEFAVARQTFEENLAAAREIGAKNDEIFCYLNLAIQSHELGDFKAMDEHAGCALREAASTKSEDLAIIGGILRSLALAYLGRPAEAERLHADAMAHIGVLPAEGRKTVDLSILPYVAERQLFCGQVLHGLASAQECRRLINETGVSENEQRILVL
ncbi:MAG: hypothetical protein KGR26_09765, partial [Cyanobacteria bacterium REEB65]|nr:hypothetical protein [Cyanobacteria bacterium REEB65]